MAIKPATTLTDREQFLYDSDNKKKMGSLLGDLQDMDVEQLTDRWESIENQSKVMIWLIAYHLRERFASNIKFGNYIQELRQRNPYHPLCVNAQSSINRFIHAGRFALKHKITDVDKVGISPTVLYKLSSPVNENVADSVYKEIRSKNPAVAEVDRLIMQKKSLILGSSHVAETFMDKIEEETYKAPKERVLLAVIDNVVQLPNAVNEASALVVAPQTFVLPEVMPAIQEEESDEDTDEIYEPPHVDTEGVHYKRMSIINHLSSFSTKGLSEDEIFSEMKQFCLSIVEHKAVSFLNMNKLLKQLIDANTQAGYGN